MVRGRELAEVTKAVHWATLRQPAPVLTTAFAQFRALVRPPMRRPTWPATAGRYLHKSAILRVASRALLTATCEPPALIGSGRGEEEPSGRCLGSGADPLPARVSRAQPGSRRPARRCADRRSRSRPAWC